MRGDLMNKEVNHEIFLASSWKQRDRIRQFAHRIRALGHSVFDFTDSNCRSTPEIPPEKFPEKFDPGKETYWNYIRRPEWTDAIMENKKNIDLCKMIILVLPCGIDATADWAYAVGKGKTTYIIGNPREGERSPVHMWADGWFENENAFLDFLMKRGNRFAKFSRKELSVLLKLLYGKYSDPIEGKELTDSERKIKELLYEEALNLRHPSR